MEDSPLHTPQDETSKNGKLEQKSLSDSSDVEDAFFTEKCRSDSMLAAGNIESTDEGVEKGEEGDGEKEENVCGGLVSFNTLMDQGNTQEIELNQDPDIEGAIEIIVDQPRKSAEGMGAHLVYPITTKTTMQHFVKDTLTTTRRFNDFLTLYDNLVLTHQPLGIIIPLPPEKDMIGMTKMKISKEEEINNMDFVEKRRAALERFLTRVANHPKLVIDKNFVTFLQVEGELSKPSGGGLLGGGIAKWFGRVGESLTKITSALPEPDQWYEDRQEVMEATEHHLKELLTCTEALILQRKELASTTTQLSKAVANLGSTEEDLSLSKVLGALAEAIDRSEIIKASTDMQVLIDSVKDNLSFIAALRLGMDERTRVHKAWKDSETTLTKKTDQKSKLETQRKTDKLEFASMEIHEWEEKVKENKTNFEDISKTIKKEAKRLDLLRMKEMKSTMLTCLSANVQLHRQVAYVWEALIPGINKEL